MDISFDGFPGLPGFPADFYHFSTKSIPFWGKTEGA
jgi:hypothetical protein